ncbi:50S ribosomal protein L13 [Candidatus Shapirobacteria bacterium CG09_land_8_20_14_0_10_38_17]|uniref:Large ribosomal subunit protein uL13 n=1 Tax=Candidatus Shapirobacteria bacterium CG09_land_8_20_14_0_10_38_17 TaxID=1974884 RepID=A0A2H0WR73_9BACT|nr:MAG: 50S ribosomal protein L13 [Candidatus Shapirobacteria bacterium CG09_land_8_20_14_0_10_38_17]
MKIKLAKTSVTKLRNIKRRWYLVDLKDKILGREATEMAVLLRGKNKPYFTPSLDCGDHVVVINAQKVRLTGKKEDQKVYQRYSGYPGGLKEVSYRRMAEKAPNEVVRHAVLGMLPKNKLRSKMIKRLYIFSGEEHPYKDKFQITSSKLQTNSQS